VNRTARTRAREHTHTHTHTHSLTLTHTHSHAPTMPIACSLSITHAINRSITRANQPTSLACSLAQSCTDSSTQYPTHIHSIVPSCTPTASLHSAAETNTWLRCWQPITTTIEAWLKSHPVSCSTLETSRRALQSTPVCSHCGLPCQLDVAQGCPCGWHVT
jgi:hypothetical protein